MPDFTTLPPDERREYFEQAAARLGIDPLIIEKDFWVCWALRRLFKRRELEDHLLFKGGTSLSKVHRVIHRFSEDVDLGIKPAFLGVSDDAFEAVGSRSKLNQKMKELERKCDTYVRGNLRELLETDFRSVLGDAEQGTWLSHGADEQSVLRFEYPSDASAQGYIAKSVKLEFGSLTNQVPLEAGQVRAMVAEELDLDHPDAVAPVIVMAFGRTFWEKATILHAEFHRPHDTHMPPRYARHYADVADMWRDGRGRVAAKDLAQLDEVRRFEDRFFYSAWAHYDAARQGSLRLVPPTSRRVELDKDLQNMRLMFLRKPPTLDEVLASLGEAESAINAQ